MSSTQELTTAKSHKKKAKAAITRLQSSLAQPGWTLATVNSKLEILRDSWKEFKDANVVLEHHAENQDAIVVLEQEYEEVNAKYEDILDNLNIKKEEFQAQASSEHSSRSSTPVPSLGFQPMSTSVKLPKLDFGSFSGNYKDWNSFADIFTAVVDKNSNLNEVTKLQYLLSKVKDEPKKLLSSLQVTEANYRVAWNILKERYDNRKVIIYEHLKVLFSLQAVAQDSGSELRKLLDSIVNETRALEVMGFQLEGNDYADLIMSFFLMQKVDNKTHELWNMQSKDKEIPKWKDLLTFVDKRCRDLESRDQQSSTTSLNPGQGKEQTRNTHHVEITKQHCVLCPNENHPLYKCQVYGKLTVLKRKKCIKANGLCFKCLRPGHRVGDCSFKFNCRTCNKAHHTSIHEERKEIQGSGSDKEDKNKMQDPRLSAHVKTDKTVLLATAMVHVEDKNGRAVTCRALIDQCSQVSIMSEDCVRKLGVKRHNVNEIIKGVGDSSVLDVKGEAWVKVSSVYSEFTMEVECLIMPKVTGFQPGFKMEPSSEWSHLENLMLADPTYYKSGKVDILLGADHYAAMLRDGIRKLEFEVAPVAQNTKLGWLVFGAVHAVGDKVGSSHFASVLHVHSDDQIRKFWELEEIPEPKSVHFTDEEKRCEAHFQETHIRDKDGRFIVRIPFNEKINDLGSSRSQAYMRLMQMERKLNKFPSQKIEYVKFLEECENLGHMSKLSFESNLDANFIPHHYVEKLDSTTTKLRVVFDASARTSTGVSFNDTQLVGPKLQDDLVNKVLRFRKHQIAFVCDVAKMFRQILVHPDDRKYQRILWRRSDDDRVEEYELNTVTYGTASAPYLATKCIQQLAMDEAQRFPMASIVAEEDAFMDDVVTGDDQIELAIRLQDELIGLYKAGGFVLRKFMSNNPQLVSRLPSDLRAIEGDNIFESDENFKTLGISWDFKSDRLYFKPVDFVEHPVTTKRTISSDLAKTFDPLGWISPVLIVGKIILQKLWFLNIDWDGEVPDLILNEWKEFKFQLSRIGDITFPRCVFLPDTVKYEIHGFGDASEQAYSAVVYIVSVDSNGRRSSSLLIAKTKVAPLKQVTIPKLELCAAVLVAKLVKMVITSFKSRREHLAKEFKVFTWSDSTIVLGWLDSESRRWKTFVGNRVAKVQTILPESKWGHVESESNPADCASRGIPMTELIGNQLWWQGPRWLLDDQLNAQQKYDVPAELMKKEEKSKVVLFTVIDEPWITRFSSLTKLISITGYGLRLFRLGKLKQKADEFVLTLEEREEALLQWIKRVQLESFGDELKRLARNKRVQSSLESLLPFLDEKGVMRVGGRLQNAGHLREETRHPIILPKGNNLSRLIALDAHNRNFHAGQTLTLASIRQKYWIVGARKLVTETVQKCTICVKYRGLSQNPQMGNLPQGRITPSAPFLHTGTDFAGPFMIRTWSGRGRKSVKGYICLFVCFATKAIHLELVSEMTTAAFLAALDRFVSIRGKPMIIYSDNGSNYVGAERELRDFYDLQESRAKIIDHVAKEAIKWKFMPPGGPHFGGLWESGVKSMKGHLRTVLGSSSFTVEEMTTVLAKIGACLNSRPLSPLTSQPDDLEVLTPGHFLIGRPLNSIPHPDLTDLKWNSLDRWQKCQQVTQNFWSRWSDEYLLDLQKRNKWTEDIVNMKTGTMVLVMDENLPPASWRLGRVLDIIKGSDGKVRVAKVLTAKGELTRPIVKLCILPIDVSCS